MRSRFVRRTTQPSRISGGGARRAVVVAALSLLAASSSDIRGASAFVVPGGGSTPSSASISPDVVNGVLESNDRRSSAAAPLASTVGGDAIDRQRSFVLAADEVHPLIRLEKDGKEKIVNAFGVWSAIVSVITAPVWLAAMKIVDVVCEAIDGLDPNRAVYDYTGKVWSRLWLAMTMSYPDVTGDHERLKEGQGPCLFVANHASWLDIPVLCTVLDPVFKFIAKRELSNVPCIGHQLVGGHHILIDRDDRRSQLRTFKEGVSWLKKGVPLMAFPEGKRSKDGRLMEFKGGLFSMAVKTKVPIVPLSVSNTHAVMPANALLPVQPGTGKLHVHVHPPIETSGKTEEELVELVRTALLSKLPPDQHPSPPAVVHVDGLDIPQLESPHESDQQAVLEKKDLEPAL